MKKDINQTKQVVYQYVIDLAPEHKEKVTNDTNLFEEGILDSLGVVALINFIEIHYKIEIDDADFEMDLFESVNAISKFLHEKYFDVEEESIV
ncbi:acyl carrier protein (plasmid) [Bacillus cereus]|uniref:Acyl carrier protein n=1 Tax=Bacillus cereus TaxID=1396 RepID=A0AB73UU59_BACCE|nr:acyl carrier protein [Bacillus cereus]QHV47439.2 acyl carrier protein [Bacillus cereus]HDR3523486.1 acyl carrier protein [Bacillus pacificus]HDR3634043.1 acyl carrier protein [Bacillus pacificus]HDR7652979.1 acyl carrier protein [Bacillus pacificus]